MKHERITSALSTRITGTDEVMVSINHRPAIKMQEQEYLAVIEAMLAQGEKVAA